MKKYLMAILPVFLLFAGCSKESPVDPEPVFTAESECGYPTKPSFEFSENVYLVKWKSTDEVMINGAKYGVSPVASQKTKATFSRLSGDVPASPYKACVPYNCANYSGGVMTVTFPSAITNVSHNVGFWPMYAESESTSLDFKNLAGAVRISIFNTISRDVKSVTITSDKYLSGIASIVKDGDSFKAVIPTGDHSVTVDCSSSPLDVKEQENYLFVTLPPETYTTFTITIAYTDGTETVKTLKSSSSIVVQRSMVTNIELNLYSPGASVNEGIGDDGKSYGDADFL